MTDNHNKKQRIVKTEHLKPYQWKKGQSGNPKGRPKGKTLKEFAREYLEQLPDEEKIEYLKSLPTDLVWKMAEGNPHQTSDNKHDVEFPATLIELLKNNSK